MNFIYSNRILIIEDDPVMRSTLVQILMSSHSRNLDPKTSKPNAFKEGGTFKTFEVDVVETGEKALDRMSQATQRKNPYALAFVDMRLSPGMDGLQLIPKLWDCDPDLQIVICTAHSDSLQELHNNLHRTDQWIIQKKPLDPLTVQQIARAQVTKWNMLKQTHQHLEEIKRLNRLFEQFVPIQLLSRIQESDDQSLDVSKIKPEYLTILFCDIRDFTSMSENLSPQDTMAFLNSYLNRMGKVIMKHKGFIDKFLGDGLMAIFDGPEAARHAVEAAIDMQNTLQKVNKERASYGWASIRVGIGIHTGEVYVGTLGTDTRKDSTVVGDAVNLASRIESLTKLYQVNLLISEETYEEIKQVPFQAREIDTIKVKGKEKAVTIYEIFDADPEPLLSIKQQSKMTLEAGIVLYKCHFFLEAKQSFLKSYSINKENFILEYLERCDWFMNQPPENDEFWQKITSDGQWKHDYYRSDKRYNILLPCTAFVNGRELSDTFTFNFSRTGMRLENVPEPLQENDKISVFLKTLDDPYAQQEDSEKDIVFFGKIIKSYRQGDKWSVGVRFI